MIVTCLRWFDNVQRRPYATVMKYDTLDIISTSNGIGTQKLGYTELKNDINALI